MQDINIQLYPQQQQALDAICGFIESDNQVFILKGYAGTGKTTMISAVLPTLRKKGKEIILLAPTGRAAKTLMDKTGHEASTIHRTIYEIQKVTSVLHDNNGKVINKVDYFYKDEHETRQHDVAGEFWFALKSHTTGTYTPDNAVYIVDESSMISSKKVENEQLHFGSDILLNDLLEYAELRKGGKIIFVGDPAQLPPIGDRESAALNEEFFSQQGLRVEFFELTDIIRQSEGSIVLENAMQVRNLLHSTQRNALVFKRRPNEVEDVSATEVVTKYLELFPEPVFGAAAIIGYSNREVKLYNDTIRTYYYPGQRFVQVGDILQVVKNHYMGEAGDLYNGDFVKVLDVSAEVETQSAPVLSKIGKQKTTISLTFRDVTVQDDTGAIYKTKIIDSLLNNMAPSLSMDEYTALYINFRMRHPGLSKDHEVSARMLMNDPYYNALHVKYGYAITGHKSQGGDWDTVFVDYSGRTGLKNDCLRWIYTVTTRAKNRLYGVNMPNIRPFDKLICREIAHMGKTAGNARCIADAGEVDLLPLTATNAQKAKCQSARSALNRIGRCIERVELLPYKDRYYIKSGDVVEKYDCIYNGAGYYTTYQALQIGDNNADILAALRSEECYIYKFDYQPSLPVLEELYAKIMSICDELEVCITNIVENVRQYNVVYFLKTSGAYSCIKFFFDKNNFITYAQPFSDIGMQDVLLQEIIKKLS